MWKKFSLRIQDAYDFYSLSLSGGINSCWNDLWHSGRLKNGPVKDIYIIILGTCKFTFAGVMKLKILWWVDYSGLSGYPLNTVTNVLVEEGQRDILYTQKGKGKMATNSEIRVIEHKQGMLAVTKTWQRLLGFSLWTFRGNLPLPTPWFNLMRLISDFWPPDLWQNKLLF